MKKKRTHAQIGRMSRAKGHAFEREIAVRMREIFPDARRKLENHRADAVEGVDIMFTGRYKIQCKRGRKYAPIGKIGEAKFDEILGDVPVLVTQGDRTTPMAVIPLEAFLELAWQYETYLLTKR